jgi:hypothetical protein
MPPMPIKLSFLPRTIMSFFLLTKKLKPKDVHGRSSNYTLGRFWEAPCTTLSLGAFNLEELTPNICELRVCAALSKSDKHVLKAPSNFVWVTWQHLSSTSLKKPLKKNNEFMAPNRTISQIVSSNLAQHCFKCQFTELENLSKQFKTPISNDLISHILFVKQPGTSQSTLLWYDPKCLYTYRQG